MVDRQLYDIFFLAQHIKYQHKNLLLPSSLYVDLLLQFDDARKFENSALAFVDIINLMTHLSELKVSYLEFLRFQSISTHSKSMLEDILQNQKVSDIYHYFDKQQLNDVAAILGLEDIPSLLKVFLELINLTEKLLTDQELLDEYIFHVNMSKFNILGFTKALLAPDKDTLMLEMITPLWRIENFLLISDPKIRELTIYEVFEASERFSNDQIDLIRILLTMPEEFLDLLETLFIILRKDIKGLKFVNQKYNINLPEEYEDITDGEKLLKFFKVYAKSELNNPLFKEAMLVSKFTLPQSFMFFESMVLFTKYLIENKLIFIILKYSNESNFQKFLDDIFLISNLINILNHYSGKEQLREEIFKDPKKMTKYINVRLDVFRLTCREVLKCELLDFDYIQAKKFILNFFITKNGALNNVSTDLILKYKFNSILESPFVSRTVIELLLNLGEKVKIDTEETFAEKILTIPLSFEEILSFLSVSLESDDRYPALARAITLNYSS